MTADESGVMFRTYIFVGSISNANHSKNVEQIYHAGVPIPTEL